MPAVTRPDGVEIHWDLRGEGPLVLLVHQVLWSYPEVWARLIEELATDHAVITFDPRGCGESTREGPYDLDTDAGDLAAVAEAAGGGAVALAAGYGYNLAARVAVERPELTRAVVGVAPAAAAMLPRSELGEAGVMAASDSVMELMIGMLNTDPRMALRTVIAMSNPDLSEDEVRARHERAAAYLSPEAALARTKVWLEDDPSEYAIALGGRLWILHGEEEPLYEGALRERVSELYPQAHIEEAPGGPITRPEITAAVIRRLTV